MKKLTKISGHRVSFYLASALFSASALVTAGPAYAVEANPGPTPMPEIKGCSGSQEARLRTTWRRAHEYTWRADRMLQYIKKQSDEDRQYLWSFYYQHEVAESTSPKSFFGPWNGARFQNIEDAVQKAVRRFENRGSVVRGIKTLRCGQPIAGERNEHTDVCTSLGGDGGPSAYHAVPGHIVTCPKFWSRAFDSEVSLETRLHNSAETLVHEIFHWLSVDGKYITDLHGGKKRYGLENISLLARKHPDWAIRNNDTYSNFIGNVGRAKPTFSALWVGKSNSNERNGAFYVDQTWNSLVGRWRDLGSSGQYLSSVRTYVKNGERRYTGVWQHGPGNGALYRNLDWNGLVSKFYELRSTQHLLNVETYKVGNSFRYIGVWKKKRLGDRGNGGLQLFDSWSDLITMWRSLGSRAYLRDIETFVSGGKRYYVVVSLPGGGNGALLWTKDYDDFKSTVDQLQGRQFLLDYEQYLDGGGTWNYIGIWKRAGGRDSGISRNRDLDFLLSRREALAPNYLLLDVNHFGPLPTRIP